MPDQCGELETADYGEETRPDGLQCTTDDETVDAPDEHNTSSSSDEEDEAEAQADEEDEAEAQADVAGTTETPMSKKEQRRLKKLADEEVKWPSIEPGVALPEVLRREAPTICEEGGPNKSMCTRKAGDHPYEYFCGHWGDNVIKYLRDNTNDYAVAMAAGTKELHAELEIAENITMSAG